MHELLERYCEELLRNQYSDTLAGYHQFGYSETRLGTSDIRRDFIIPSQNRVVDSKYKYWYCEGVEYADLMQLSLYAGHSKALEKLNNHDIIPKLQFIYPNSFGNTGIDFKHTSNKEIYDFENFYKYPITLIQIKSKQINSLVLSIN